MLTFDESDGPLDRVIKVFNVLGGRAIVLLPPARESRLISAYNKLQSSLQVTGDSEDEQLAALTEFLLAVDHLSDGDLVLSTEVLNPLLIEERPYEVPGIVSFLRALPVTWKELQADVRLGRFAPALAGTETHTEYLTEPPTAHDEGQAEAEVFETVDGDYPENGGNVREGTRAANGGPPDEPPADIVRFPDLDYPDETVVGTPVSLTVSLLMQAPEVEALPIIIADTGGDFIDIDAVVRAPGFIVKGTNMLTMKVPRGADCDVRFVLTARKTGRFSISVDFYQADRPIGTALREAVVVEQPSVNPEPVPPVIADIEIQKEAIDVPDLDLVIASDGADPNMLYFRLHSAREDIDFNFTPVGDCRIVGGPLAATQELYNELTAIARKKSAILTPEQKDLQEERLKALGRGIWDRFFPKELKEAYWKVKGKAESLQITSEEPWIPWELALPYRYDEDNHRIDEPFLCQSFIVGRWLTAGAPAYKIRTSSLRAVMANSTNTLGGMKQEIAYLERIDEVQAGVSPETPYGGFKQVVDLLENGSVSILHFAAHGAFNATNPDNSALALADAELHPSDIKARFGGSRPRPLIFMNACHGGRADYAFTGLGGWASCFVTAKVGAFIGASWEINDGLALSFTKAFYSALLGRRLTFGESFRVAREAIRAEAPWNSTWLAYVLYADPIGRADVGAR